MVKPLPLPSYQPLTLHAVSFSVIPLVIALISHCNSTSTDGIKLKLTPALALDKGSQFMISTIPRDPCAFYRSECNFADVSEI